MASDDGAVDDVPPVVGQTEINQRGEHRVPHTLFGTAPETDIDRVPPPRSAHPCQADDSRCAAHVACGLGTAGCRAQGELYVRKTQMIDDSASDTSPRSNAAPKHSF